MFTILATFGVRIAISLGTFDAVEAYAKIRLNTIFSEGKSQFDWT